MPLLLDDFCRITLAENWIQSAMQIEVHKPDATLPDWIKIQTDQIFSSFAEDGSGGIFIEGQPSGCICYITSEGSAGCVAASLESFVQLVAALPQWEDVLKLSGGGKLIEMQNAANAYQNSCEDDDYYANAETRQALLDKFALAPAKNVVGALYFAVSQASGLKFQVMSNHNELYSSLFGNFTLKDRHHYNDMAAEAAKNPSEADLALADYMAQMPKLGENGEPADPKALSDWLDGFVAKFAPK